MALNSFTFSSFMMRKKRTYVFLAVIFILIVSIVVKTNQRQPTKVIIDSGVIEGFTDSTREVSIFKGIPYAAPPIGDLRWRAPQPVQPWEGVRRCTSFGASPVQVEPTPILCWSEEYLIPKEPISEDCLSVNVWTGATGADEKRPVLVYVYGGGFFTGGSACPVYDGVAMAKKGIVYVNFNYRLGKLGFMAHPELSKESENHSSGNYALMDMIAALQWVKRNISAFGGDPNKVTLAGQSAGAVAVNYLTTSPLAKGLFHQAIAESGSSFEPGVRDDELYSLHQAEKEGLAFAEALNCRSIAELRTKSATEILKASKGFSSPNIDGYIVPESSLRIYQEGKQSDIPVLLGWNLDDLEGGAVTKEEFKERLNDRFGDMAEAFLKEYPAGSDAEATQSLAYLIRDEYFGIKAYTWAKVQRETGTSAVFLYHFNRDLPGNSDGRDFGAFHSGEIPYAYDNLHTLNRPWSEADHELADRMSDYWVNFVKTGNPNGDGLPTWTPFDPVHEHVMVFDTLSGSMPLPSKSKLLVWEHYYNSLN